MAKGAQTLAGVLVVYFFLFSSALGRIFSLHTQTFGRVASFVILRGNFVNVYGDSLNESSFSVTP